MLFWLFVSLISSAQITTLVENAELKLLCGYKKYCPSEHLPQTLNLALASCRLRVDSKECRDLIRKEPEFNDALMRCQPNEYCEDQFSQEIDFVKGCGPGFLEGSGEALQGFADFINAFSKNVSERNAFAKMCDEDLECKKILVEKLPKFENISDASLRKYSTAQLLVEVSNFEYAISTYKRQIPQKKAGQIPVHPPSAGNIEITKKVIEWLRTKHAHFECLDTKTRGELFCWGAAYLVDPLMIAGGTIKLARGAKYIADLVAENGGKIDIAEKALSLRTVNTGVFSQLELAGTRLETVIGPALPSSMQLARYRTAEGREYLAVERALKTSSGEIKTSIREIPIDPTTGSINARTPVGAEVLEALVADGEKKSTLAFFDITNLGYINKNFANSKAGDQVLKDIAAQIQKVAGSSAMLFRNGGDEFVLVMRETDTAKVNETMNRILEAVDGKEVNKTFREEKIARAKKYDPSDPDARANQLAFARYSRAGVSAGSSAIGPGESVSTVLARAEDRAKDMKIEMKEKMNIDATKYGGKPADRDAQPQMRYLPTAAEPAVSNTHGPPTPPQPKLSDSTGVMNETREGDIYRFGDTIVGRYKDERGQTVIREENYSHTKDGRTIRNNNEIIMNDNTRMVDATIPQGREVFQRFVLSESEAKPKLIIMVDAQDLAKTNYYNGGSVRGDELLKATSDVIRQTLSDRTGLPLKLQGGQFAIGLDHRSPIDTAMIRTKLKSALQNDPAIRKIKAEQRAYLEGELKAASESPEKIAEIKRSIENLNQPPNFGISTTTVENTDQIDDVVNRLRSRLSAL